MKVREKIKKKINHITQTLKKKCKRLKGKCRYLFHPKTIRRKLRHLHPKQVWGKIRAINPHHWLLLVVTAVSIALAVTHYRLSLERAWQTVADFLDSIVIYFKVMASPTMELPEGMTARIAQIPEVDLQGVLPFDLEELRRRLSAMWGCIFRKEYLVAYLKAIINRSYYFILYGMTVIELLFVLWLLFQRSLFAQKTDHGRDTVHLKRWKRGPERVYRCIRKRISDFWTFFQASKYKPVLTVIWVINFNLIAIITELVAFYFYFIATFELKALFVQVVRLLLDVLIMLFSTPFPVWFVIGWLLFDRFRRKIGFQSLRAFEADNCDFLKKLPVVSMLLGTMGTGKTTMLTDVGLSQQNVFREKAKDLLFQADLKFPDFPWQKFEDALQGAIEHHKIAYVFKRAAEDQTVFDKTWYLFAPADWRYWLGKLDRGIWSLSSCRSFVDRVRAKYEADPTPHNLYGYDVSKNAATYQDGLTVSDLFDVLKDYAQLYYLYATKSPLLVSNYSVRSDAVPEDVGNFPEWNMDFFERDPAESAEHSQNAHIVDFDTLRLSNLVDPENSNKGSFEFGVTLLSEIGKERGNQVENRHKKKTDEEANALNDGFNARLKMSRHAAVIANYPFIKIFTDEQRAESWGADARDLCKLVTIEERSDLKIAMPFFSLEGLIYECVYPAFKDFYYRLRFTRGDNTLTGYLTKKAFCAFYNHYIELTNIFGYSVLTVDLKDGTTDGNGKGKKYEYYLCNKKIYSNRFSTDCYADLFAVASMRASVGLDDYPQYQTTRATWDEMEKQNSYFVKEMTKQFKEK